MKTHKKTKEKEIIKISQIYIKNKKGPLGSVKVNEVVKNKPMMNLVLTVCNGPQVYKCRAM